MPPPTQQFKLVLMFASLISSTPLLVLLPPLDTPLQGRVPVPQVGTRPHQWLEGNQHQQQEDNHRPQLQ